MLEICQAWGVAVGSAGGANMNPDPNNFGDMYFTYIFGGPRTLSCFMSFFIGSFCICFNPALASQISAGKAANSSSFSDQPDPKLFMSAKPILAPAKMSILQQIVTGLQLYAKLFTVYADWRLSE